MSLFANQRARHALSTFRGQLWCMTDLGGRAMVESLEEIRLALLAGAKEIKRSDLPARSYEVQGATAFIPVRGPIIKGAVPWFFEALGIQVASTTEILGLLARALADDSVKAITFLVDSPGGMVAGLQALANAIFAARSVKPISAHIEDMGASAAYHIASQAETVSANEGAWVGSIGTYMTILDSSGAAKAEGYKAIVIKSDGAEHKAVGEPGVEVTEKQKARLRKLVNDSQALFNRDVARGRGMTNEQATKLATGEVWLADEAQELGLIDSVSNAPYATPSATEEGGNDEVSAKELDELRAQLAERDERLDKLEAKAEEAERKQKVAEAEANAKMAERKAEMIDQALAEGVRPSLEKIAEHSTLAELKASLADFPRVTKPEPSGGNAERRDENETEVSESDRYVANALQMDPSEVAQGAEIASSDGEFLTLTDGSRVKAAEYFGEEVN